MKYGKEVLTSARITVDEQGEGFKMWFSTALKKGLNTDKIIRVKKVAMADSRRENLLQLTDYIAGITYRHYDEAKGSKKDYLKIIQYKCIKTIIRPDNSKEK